ncbi:MAG: putative transcriptional regulator, partial [Geminicoccaceae bacterium]|nr:putative transcriptional regulator [Geminicoccaceae bacterium]
VAREGRAETVAVLESRYSELTERLRGELAEAAPAERLSKLARLLTEDGYMAEASGTANTATLTEHNCAIRSVAERFPEICAAEAKFLAAVLGGVVHREKHILSGCSACEYRVSFEEQAAPIKEESV